MAKGKRAERESEGFGVPLTAATKTPPEGRDPASVALPHGGKGEGMPERANHPTPVTSPGDKARELQRKLFIAAKQDGNRRFHALFDRVCRGDVLVEAWRRVRTNGGAAGIDGETLAEIEQRGVFQFLRELREHLKTGTYRPQPVKRRYIPKSDGKQRPLGIPTVRDRVAQMAVKIVIEPIFEAGFQGCSYGFRPKRSATQALEVIRVEGRWKRHVVDGDIKSYFDTIDHDLVMQLVERRISDRRVLKILRQWLKAGVVDDGAWRPSELGSPQGGVISPLLANIFLDYLDRVWNRQCAHLGTLVRYADDFVVLCKTRSAAEEARRRLEIILGRLRLTLHPDKTKLVELGLGKEGFTFLGCHVRIMQSHKWKKEFVFRWPGPKTMDHIRDQVRELTDRSRRAGMKDVREVIRDLNPVLRGWGNYFRTGNASIKFQQVDSFVRARLIRLLSRRGGDRAKAANPKEWTWDRLKGLGLHRLLGHIRYPGKAHAA